MIKFNKYNVVNTETKEKARVFYSNSTLIDGSKCVTNYAKDYDRALGRVFQGIRTYVNESDLMTDYFDQGHVRIFTGDPLYAAAHKRFEVVQS